MKLEEEIENNIFIKPYFVHTGDQEKFYVVKSIISNPKENKSARYSYDEKIGELILDQDIKEENTRGLNILVKYPTNNQHLSFLSTILELQKFAKLCLCDYVGIEKINGIYSSETLIPGYARVQPRLFRKIIDN